MSPISVGVRLIEVPRSHKRPTLEVFSCTSQLPYTDDPRAHLQIGPVGVPVHKSATLSQDCLGEKGLHI